MRVYICEDSLESKLCGIHAAMTSKIPHQELQLVVGDVEQYSLLDSYVHVETNIETAGVVAKAIRDKISSYAYHQVAYASMSYESDALNVIYRVLLLGFKYGAAALNMVQYKDVMRFSQICHRMGKEVSRFQEVTRFHLVGNGFYVAHIEPKSKLIAALGPIFEDRMPSESFMIIDDVHKEAVVHPADERFYIRQLNEEEFSRLLETEQMNDSFTDMWRAFFDAIAIKERENPRCQMNLLPRWTRKHAVEFGTKN